MGLAKALVPHIISIIQTAAHQKRTHIQTQMGRCPIPRKSERPGELSLNWKYSHKSGYVTGGGNLAKSIALFGMSSCDLEGRHRWSRGTCYFHLLLAVFSSTLEMQVTGSKMWRSPTWPNHQQKMESETGKKPGFDSSIKDCTKTFFGSNANFHQGRWERCSNQENNRHTLSSNLQHFCTFIKLLYYCIFSVALKLSTCSRLIHFDKSCISREVTFAVLLLYRILSDIMKI